MFRRSNPLMDFPRPPRGPRRHRRAINFVRVASAVPLVLAAQAIFAPFLTVNAVDNTGVFQLDGNIAHDVAGGTYDWADLFNSSGGQAIVPSLANPPGQILQSAFANDTAAPDNTYFQGSMKDPDLISNWVCTTVNNPTPKDNIENAYAAMFRVPTGAPENAGDAVVTLGMEREVGTGDSYAGFWLLKDSTVGCTGTGNGSHVPFSGNHTVGDLLLISNFTNGGGVQDVRVYQWVAGGPGGHLDTTPLYVGPVCGVASPDDTCAIANTGGAITGPWAPTSHPANSFVEFGIDLTTVLGRQGNGCFASFLGETRSSQVVDQATLKDFVLHPFDTCVNPMITTTSSAGGLPGSSQTDHVTVGGPGNSFPAGTGTVQFFLCDPAQVTGAGCPSGGTQINPAQTLVGGAADSPAVSGATTTTLGRYCWRAAYTPTGASLSVYHPGSETNSTTECFTIAAPPPSLSVVKTADAASVVAGSSIGFTVTVSNSGAAGTGTATAVTLNDPLPSGTDVSWSISPAYAGPGSCMISGGAGAQTLSCAFGDLAPGASAMVHVTSGTTTNSCKKYDNTATASATNSANSPQNSASTTVTCPAPGSPALSVIKTADAASVPAGTNIGFTVTVSNSSAAGTATATSATLNDPLPSGSGVSWTISPAYAGPGTCMISGGAGAQTLSCAFGNLAAGASATVHVTSATTTKSCQAYNNTATASATNSANSPQDSASTTVTCPPPPVNPPALSVVKTADAASVVAGSSIGFTVTVSNSGAAGTGTATAVSLNDPLPSGTDVSWTISPAYGGPGTCMISGGTGAQTLSCAFGDLAPGASASVQVTSATTTNSCQQYDNTATASATNSANSPQDSANTTVTCPAPGSPALSVIKTADATSVAAGSNIGFTITVSNSSAAGTAAATAATLNDPLPSGSGVSWTISPAYTGPGTCMITTGGGGQTLTCAFGTLAAGASASVHVTSATTTASCQAYNNTATASATNSANSPSDGASTSVTCPAGAVVTPSTGGPVTTPLTGVGQTISSGLLLVGTGLIPFVVVGLTGRRRRRMDA